MWSPRRLWAALIVLMLCSFAAYLFGPAERWWGVDVGATGASLFHLSLAGLLVLIGLKRGEVFPDAWSLAERRAWTGMAFSTLILVGFGKFLWLLAALETVPARPYELPARHLLSLIVGLGIAWGISAHLLGRGAGPVDHDERDLRLRFEADRAGDLALCLAVVGSVLLLANVSAPTLTWWLEPMVLANVLIAVLVGKLLVEYAALVALYLRARR
jgi:hypothetical protein